MSEPTTATPRVISAPPSWPYVLAALPPGTEYVDVELAVTLDTGHVILSKPILELYCDNHTCQRQMLAQCKESTSYLQTEGECKSEFLTYACRNCGTRLKLFAISVVRTKGVKGTAIKLGEWPPFSPHVPSKMMSVLGGDWGVFVQGRRSEALGMGIGAFAYYRRVVERRKDDLIAEIIKVAEKVKAPPDVLDSLRGAAKDTQFKKALETVKVPESLLVDGHNPLMLLHGAISEGLHAESDKECLEYAQAIRHVLVELVQRIDSALKSHAELKESLQKLLEKQAKKRTVTSAPKVAENSQHEG